MNRWAGGGKGRFRNSFFFGGREGPLLYSRPSRCCFYCTYYNRISPCLNKRGRIVDRLQVFLEGVGGITAVSIVTKRYMPSTHAYTFKKLGAAGGGGGG